MLAYINTDAACTVKKSGELAPMRIGYVIRTQKGRLLVRAGYAVRDMTGSEFGTVNRAEYLAVIHALRHAARLGFSRAEVTVDSQLVARQLSGAYRIKDRVIERLAREVRGLGQIISVDVKWVKREHNAEADALAHESVFEEPAGMRPEDDRMLLGWQAALARRWASARPDLPTILFARIFQIDTDTQLSPFKNILRGDTYANANLDSMPDWDSYPLDSAELRLESHLPEAASDPA